MSCCETIRPENAARRFDRPAPILSTIHAKQLLKAHAGARVLEIGAGCLRNAMFLLKEGFAVSVLEVPAIETRFPQEYAKFRAAGGKVYFKMPSSARFAFAVCTFVIETICSPAARKTLLRSTAEVLNHDGFLLLSVRGPADLVTAQAKGVSCEDGFITPNRTFARSFTKAELSTLLRAGRFPEVEFLHKATTEAPELLHAVAWKSNDRTTPSSSSGRRKREGRPRRLREMA